MKVLPLHEFHRANAAQFTAVNGCEVVAHYGDALAEHAALRTTAGVLDLSFRSRLCLTGADRVRFLHGQVTNNVKDLPPCAGCYAALTTAKGKMQSDLNLYHLADELLLDFEPGLTAAVSQRLEKYLVADDVQLIDAAPHYGLLSVQGPQAAAVIRALGWAGEIPPVPFRFNKISEAALGEIYLMNQPRLGTTGFDVFVPVTALATVAAQLLTAAAPLGGRAAGWDALEIARIEAGIPRYGADMDETNLPLECGIENRAVSYQKGCYIGQEVINRVHSFGQVTRALRGLRLADGLETLPARGEKLFAAGKEVGFVTGAVYSPACQANLALGYVRKETNQLGAELQWQTCSGPSPAIIVGLPFAAG